MEALGKWECPNIEACVWQMQPRKPLLCHVKGFFEASHAIAYTLAAHESLLLSTLPGLPPGFYISWLLAKKQQKKSSESKKKTQ
ncbi:hypothetical protein [Hymenobacter lapidarius]|uniref:hypothetical protein n=1 Tax=Hymenobacter lapidarius TaxID=1908237 RepID=UPI000F7A5F76|nr:hypothetical protein [Hymenobacter lapidarius]